MTKYKYLLFDLDDTLIDNRKNTEYALKSILKVLNIPYTKTILDKWLIFDRDYWKYLSNNPQIFYSQNISHLNYNLIDFNRSYRFYLFFPNITLEKALSLNKLFIENQKHLSVPLQGTYKTLKYLSNKYILIITTNGPIEAVKSKLSNINCLHFFKYIFSSDLTTNYYSKPHPLYFQELKNNLNYYDKSKFLIIGDSLDNDIQGGINSNIDTCWLNTNNLTNNLNPTYIINCLEQLITIL